MSNDFLPFSKPTIDEATLQEVVDCIKSGWMATGPRVQKFAEDLKTYLDAPFVKPLTSGTAALHMSLLGFDLQPGDEVITCPMTFVASANTIIQAGAKPVFVDADIKTYNIDVNQIEAAITHKTKAIMPIHYAGLPADLDPIYALAEKYNLRILEDGAHAIGASYKGKKLGSFGDTQIFSFHPNKNMTTGEGGCIATRDEALYKLANVMSFHGIDREAWNRFSKDGKQHYDVIAPGFKFNMLDIQAAIGLHQLPKLDEFNAKRRTLAERYLNLLEGWKEISLPAASAGYDATHAWHLFVPLINVEEAKMSRDDFMEAMKSCNIGTGFHYDAVHLFSYYQKTFGYKRGDFPNTEKIAERIVSLPLFPTMTFEEQDRVITAMKTVFKKED